MHTFVDPGTDLHVACNAKFHQTFYFQLCPSTWNDGKVVQKETLIN